MKNDLDNAKEFFLNNNFESFTPEQLNVIGKTMRDYAEQFAKKAEKWDILDEKIGKFYEVEHESSNEEEGTLLDIGEAACIAFGYL